MARPRKNTPKPNTQELSLVPVEEQPYPLPEGWKWVRLGDVASKISDGSHNPPKNSGSGIPLLSATNIQDRTVRIEDATRWITEDEWQLENKRTKIEINDILITIVGTLGRVALVTNPKFALQRSVAVIKTNQNQTYISYFFESPYVQDFINKNAKGTAQKGFYLKALEKLCCALPPLDEQERIVTRIESLFAKLDKAKEKAGAVLDSYETRKAAILHKAFTGELTATWREETGLAFEWKEKTLADIGTIVTGSTPSTKHPEYYGKEVPFIKPTDLNAGRYVIQSTEYLSKEGVKVSRPVKAGSTCVCCIGTISKCGFLLCNAVTNQQINTICPYDFMHDLFVYYWCTSSTFKQTLIENSSATTLPIINKSRMSALPIPVPTLPEQQEITRILDSLLEKEQQSKEAAETVLEQIDLMKKAILAKAFRGELG